MSSIEQATTRSIKPFKSSEEYLYAMKEDLAEWLKDLYSIDIAVNNFLEILETGSILCYHANNVTRVAGEFLQEYGEQARRIHMPTSGVTFVNSAQPATFLARDNISNFINWCRKQMNIKDVLMFETDDLVLRKNEKHFVLCLLEVARRASRFGMAAPVLIQLEHEIEEEIREELDLPQEETPLPRPQRRMSDFKNLDEMVQHLVSRCTCPSQFPMVKVSEGKYRVGDSSTLIFVRILRNHVMVRVGGGWDTLEHYLDKHDPCRCTSLAHKPSKLAGPQRPATPVHEIKTRLTVRQDGQGGAPSTLVLGRTQAPLAPVHWTPSAPSKGLKPVSNPPPRASSSPDPGPRTARELRPPTPIRQRERSATPTRRPLASESRVDSTHTASTRTGREVTRASPSPRLASSLPRPIQPSPASQPETQRPKTPLVFQRSPGQLSLHPQPSPDSRLAQTWTKSQFSSKLRQSATSSTKSTESQNRAPSPVNTQRQGGPVSARPFTPLRCRSPIKNVHPGPRQTAVPAQHTEDNSPPEALQFIRSFSPTKQMRGNILGEPEVRPFTPVRRGQRASGAVDQSVQRKPSPDSSQEAPLSSILNGDTTQKRKQGWRSSAHNASMFPAKQGDSLNTSTICVSVIASDSLATDLRDFQELSSADREEDDREGERECLFPPPPISPAQEASLYQSLEHEILCNMQLLGMDSGDDNSSEDTQEIYKPEPQHQHEHPAEDFSLFSTSKPSLSVSRYTAQGMPRSDSSDPSEVSREVTTKPSEGKMPLDKVDVQSWVATLPGSSRTIPQASREEAGSGHLTVVKPNMTSSWSSLGSSVDSKEPIDAGRPGYAEYDTSAGAAKAIAALEASSTASSAATTDSPTKPRTPSFKQKRALKKPERVPSIYKLKLRPRVRPRRDHRPEKKPSKIPTPLSYRRGQPGRDSRRAKRPGGRVTSPDLRDSHCSSPTLQPGPTAAIRPSQGSCLMRARATTTKSLEEGLGNQEQESWV
ncbi:GAS2-like protein 2A [Megalops cyprinoides]|uniref:GAS2-like protein 2A n=1 Tax=Megalops cyprinoides TaxID=118141 RepID=UPI001863C4F7|nr:GAS2-like protein 2A [Megalops cyprinoides]